MRKASLVQLLAQLEKSNEQDYITLLLIAETKHRLAALEEE